MVSGSVWTSPASGKMEQRKGTRTGLLVSSVSTILAMLTILGQPAKDFRCAQMDQSQNGQWISLNCSQSTDFICNIPARSKSFPNLIMASFLDPVKCTPGWEYFAKTNACYKVWNVLNPAKSQLFQNMHDHPNIDWPTADSRCKAFGAQLASIHSREENHFLTSKLKIYCHF